MVRRCDVTSATYTSASGTLIWRARTGSCALDNEDMKDDRPMEEISRA